MLSVAISIIGGVLVGVCVYFLGYSQGLKHAKFSFENQLEIKRLEGQLDVISQFKFSNALAEKMGKRSFEASPEVIVVAEDIANKYYCMGYAHRVGIEHNLPRPANVPVISNNIMENGIPISTYANDVLENVFGRTEHESDT